jgi:glyoxylate reductase
VKKVVLFGPLPDAAETRLRGRYEIVKVAHEGALLVELGDAAGLLSPLTLRVDEALLRHAPELKVVGNFAVGYDNVDVTACTLRGVIVTHTPGVLTETTADLAFALLLAVARRVPEADRKLRAGEWKGWSPDFLLGRDIFGKTLGIVGLGRIGNAVARRGLGFGMRILYTARRPVPGAPYEYLSLDELLAQSDFVSLHCPAGPLTRHLIGPLELGRMKRGACLINTARGTIVDEAALAQWVAQGGFAALDVFEEEPKVHPLLVLSDHVVLTPHIGSATVETRARMAELAAAGIDDALSGRRPAHSVNPEAWK